MRIANFCRGCDWMGEEMGRQIWGSKEWKENRKKVLKDKCEWCGSTDNLVVHHLNHQPALMIWNEIAQKMFSESEEYQKALSAPLIEEKRCPRCSRKGIYQRLDGSFRCPSCRHEFLIPAIKRVPNPDVFRRAYWEFVAKNKEKIDAEFNRVKLERLCKYLSMENCITLCKRCHFAIHNWMVLCPVCKKHYFRPWVFKITDRGWIPIRPQMCWFCFKKASSEEVEDAG